MPNRLFNSKTPKCSGPGRHRRNNLTKQTHSPADIHSVSTKQNNILGKLGSIHRNVDMRCSLANQKRHASRPRSHPLEHWPTVNSRFDNSQMFRISRPAFLRVGHGTLKHILQEPRATVVNVLQLINTLLRRLTADQICERTHFCRRNPCVSMSCSYVCHVSDIAVLGRRSDGTFVSLSKTPPSITTSYPAPRGRGTFASERTRPVCVRPSLPSHKR